MKNLRVKYCLWAVSSLILLSGALACMRELLPEWPQSFVPGLSVMPQIFRGEEDSLGGRTKAKNDNEVGIQKDDEVNAVDALRENFFGTLDVFVKKTADGDDVAWYDEYHLKAGDAGVVVDPDKYDSKSLLDQAKQLLTRAWSEKYQQGEYYDIYVTANNPHTLEGSAVKPANLTQLKALSTNTSNIYRYYHEGEVAQTDPLYWTNILYSEEKNFIMDGKKTGWTVTPDSPEQVFDVDLRRAAAKIIVNVKFSTDETFLKVAEPTDSNPSPEPEKDSQGRDIYVPIKEYLQYVGRSAGEPRWKHVNFALEGADIADGSPYTGDLDTYGSNFSMVKHGTSTDNCDNQFSLVTYTYPVDWESDGSRTPYVLLSIFYTRTSDNDQKRCYYRIPVCDETTVNKLERNHIYIVDVEIASLGSYNENLETQDEELRLEYHVIPWTTTNITQEATSVRISDTKYLTVTPTEYTLKGDDTQSVDLQWYASVSTDDKRFVDIDVSSLSVSYVNYQGNTTDIKGTVTKQIRTGEDTYVTSTDANTDGTKDIVITSTAPSGTGAVANGETVKITITPSGLIQVESKALDSRAVKDISFKVKLKNADGIDEITVNIRHFPLDNIQSISGWWSSRWNEQPYSSTTTYYTYEQTKYYRKRYYKKNSISQQAWANGIGSSNDDRINASSADGVTVGGVRYKAEGDGGTTTRTSTSSQNSPVANSVSYSWNGMNLTINGTNNNGDARNWNVGNTGYDYVISYTTTGSGSSRRGTVTLGKYESYYTVEFSYDPSGDGWGTSYDGWDWVECTQAEYGATSPDDRKTETSNVTTDYLPAGVTEYTSEVVSTSGTPSTGSWVAWGENNGTYADYYDSANDGRFYAKIYVNNSIYQLRSSNYYQSRFDALTNPQMYVIQMTSTSDKYAVGRPVLDGNYQSQDQVASPAFMIASQLGAVTPTEYPADAAKHCGTYMEVGTDGTRYVGWRLPTKQEINIIIGYQNGTYTNGRTMVEVLGGKYYWALDGTAAYVSTGTDGSETKAYVRCVRDLTLEEIKKLNGESGN